VHTVRRKKKFPLHGIIMKVTKSRSKDDVNIPTVQNCFFVIMHINNALHTPQVLLMIHWAVCGFKPMPALCIFGHTPVVMMFS